jgi:uncharacterized membrane protein YvbJ
LEFCAKCGEKLPKDAHFCPKCGARTKKGEEEGASTPLEEFNIAISKMGEEMEKAFTTAAKEIQKAFRTARESLKSETTESLVCPNCGKNNTTDSVFCYNCGQKIDQNKPTEDH